MEVANTAASTLMVPFSANAQKDTPSVKMDEPVESSATLARTLLATRNATCQW